MKALLYPFADISPVLCAPGPSTPAILPVTLLTPSTFSELIANSLIPQKFIEHPLCAPYCYRHLAQICEWHKPIESLPVWSLHPSGKILILPILTHLILTITLWTRFFYCSQISDEKMKAQRNEANCQNYMNDDFCGKRIYLQCRGVCFLPSHFGHWSFLTQSILLWAACLLDRSWIWAPVFICP